MDRHKAWTKTPGRCTDEAVIGLSDALGLFVSQCVHVKQLAAESFIDKQCKQVNKIEAYTWLEFYCSVLFYLVFTTECR